VADLSQHTRGATHAIYIARKGEFTSLISEMNVAFQVTRSLFIHHPLVLNAAAQLITSFPSAWKDLSSLRANLIF